MTSVELTEQVKGLARAEGFLSVGIAAAGPAPHAEALHDWLAKGYDAQMAYMRRNLAKRLRPDVLVRGARTVICLAASYAVGDDAGEEGLVARYARGRDYHKVLKRRCIGLMDAIRAIEPSFVGRCFVDSAPVMERTLAAAAGVGWIGRNGCLFAAGAGSYCLLCEIVCNLPLTPDAPVPGECGDCRACVAACPTGAIDGSGLLDARKCVSYLTIEHAGEIDPALRAKMGRRVFGCDACQVVCPHNQDVPAGDPELTTPLPPASAGLGQMLAWSEGDWDAATAGSAVRRAGYEQLIRNAVIAAGNSGDPSLLAPLEEAAARHPAHGELVRWAIGRLEPGGGEVL